MTASPSLSGTLGNVVAGAVRVPCCMSRHGSPPAFCAAGPHWRWVCLELLAWLQSRPLLLFQPFCQAADWGRRLLAVDQSTTLGPSGDHVVLGPRRIAMCAANVSDPRFPAEGSPALCSSAPCVIPLLRKWLLCAAVS